MASTTRAADTKRVIAERPWTITVYRADGTSDTEIDSFSGRIDEMSRRGVGLEIKPEDGTTSSQVYVLTCPMEHRLLQARDTVVAVDEDGQSITYRCLFTDDYGYKLEAILERLE